MVTTKASEPVTSLLSRTIINPFLLMMGSNTRSLVNARRGFLVSFVAFALAAGFLLQGCINVNVVMDEIVEKQVYKAKVNGTRSKLGDGCYHIFLDVGANIGVHGRFLYEPELYPKAVTARSIFDAEFGKDRDNRDFCVFAFEPK